MDLQEIVVASVRVLKTRDFSTLAISQYERHLSNENQRADNEAQRHRKSRGIKPDD